MNISKYPIIYCIYNADGTFLGELKYIINKYLYGLKCSMCEITHNTITEKKDWRDKLSQTKINLQTIHLNELKNDLYKFTYGNTPCVVGETGNGYKFIFSNTDLEQFNGNIELFFNSLENKIN